MNIDFSQQEVDRMKREDILSDYVIDNMKFSDDHIGIDIISAPNKYMIVLERRSLHRMKYIGWFHVALSTDSWFSTKHRKDWVYELKYKNDNYKVFQLKEDNKPE